MHALITLSAAAFTLLSLAICSASSTGKPALSAIKEETSGGGDSNLAALPDSIYYDTPDILHGGERDKRQADGDENEVVEPVETQSHNWWWWWPVEVRRSSFSPRLGKRGDADFSSFENSLRGPNTSEDEPTYDDDLASSDNDADEDDQLYTSQDSNDFVFGNSLTKKNFAFNPRLGKRGNFAFTPRLGKRADFSFTPRLGKRSDFAFTPRLGKRNFAFNPRLGKRAHFAFNPRLGKRADFSFTPRLGKKADFAFIPRLGKKDFAFNPRLGKKDFAFNPRLGKKSDAYLLDDNLDSDLGDME